MDICTTSTSQPCEIPRSDVTVLEGHTSEVKYFINASCYNLSSVKLSVNEPGYHPHRSVLVHGVLQDLFLRQGRYLLHE